MNYIRDRGEEECGVLIVENDEVLAKAIRDSLKPRYELPYLYRRRDRGVFIKGRRIRGGGS